MNKNEIKNALLIKLNQIAQELNLEREVVLIEPKNFGDLTTNMAMGNKNYKPLELAQLIVSKLESFYNELNIAKIEIAGPGFMNIFLKNDAFINAINQVILAKNNYGKGTNKGKVNVEYVSANPTGFLHVGHARNAAVGSSIANILEFSGYDVLREYYINDAGNQINVLAQSLFARYQQLFDKNYPMPEETYGGKDIVWGAKQIYKQDGEKFKGQKLSEEVLQYFKNTGIELFLDQIRKDLKKFNCSFDKYFSERDLYKDNAKLIHEAISSLKNTYTKDGALFLQTTLKGDDKDRVLIKSDKSFTYFLPDIAYHNIKFNNIGKGGKIINVWGADHSGYVKRVECAIDDLGHNKDDFDVFCIQLVRLIKDGSEFKMSKRRGTTFWLRDFIKTVGTDSARFLLLDRTYNSKLDFDIDLATKKTNDNPVILIQYANARTYSLLAKSNYANKEIKMKNITQEIDNNLINTILEFPEVIMQSAKKKATNLLTQYLIKLAKEFNSWYSNTDKIIGNTNEESLLAIVKAVNITLENGLRLLGISIPHEM